MNAQLFLLQVPLNEISYGLAFHPHFATDPPSPPYDNASNLDAIRHMVRFAIVITLSSDMIKTTKMGKML